MADGLLPSHPPHDDRRDENHDHHCKHGDQPCYCEATIKGEEEMLTSKWSVDRQIMP